MPVSLTTLFIGFALGVAATAIAWHLTTRTVRNPEAAKLTSVWSLQSLAAEGQKPAVLATHLRMPLPGGTKVIVPDGALADVPDEILATCEVRQHPEVHVNAAVGKEAALVFSGPVAPRTVALFTREDTTVRRLQEDFQRLWGQSTPYVERVASVSALAGKSGRVVDVAGRATEIMEFRGRKMLRLTDGRAMVGVTAQTDVAALPGSNVRVVGRMRRDAGYAYIEADRVDVLSGAAPAAPSA